MDDELRQSCSTGSQEDPLGLGGVAQLRPGRGYSGVARDNAPAVGSTGLECSSAGDNGVDPGGCHDGWNMLGRQVGRAKDNPPNDPVKLDKRHCRQELIFSRKEDRASAQLIAPGADAQASAQLGQSGASFGASEKTVGWVSCGV